MLSATKHQSCFATCIFICVCVFIASNHLYIPQLSFSIFLSVLFLSLLLSLSVSLPLSLSFQRITVKFEAEDYENQCYVQLQ